MNFTLQVTNMQGLGTRLKLECVAKVIGSSSIRSSSAVALGVPLTEQLHDTLKKPGFN